MTALTDYQEARGRGSPAPNPQNYERLFEMLCAAVLHEICTER